MFDRIDVDVIDMTAKIALVPQAMLPKTSLPEGRFTVFGFGGRQPIGTW
jgi:hypothetical protein